MICQCFIVLPHVDLVVEFGHNDGGSIATSERAPVNGETLIANRTATLQNGTVEVILSTGISKA